jgi:hypothetical protein
MVQRMNKEPGGQEPVFDPNKSTEIFSDRTAKILGDLLKTGTSLYAGKLAKDDQERINRIVEEENAEDLEKLKQLKEVNMRSPSTLDVPEQATTKM